MNAQATGWAASVVAAAVVLPSLYVYTASVIANRFPTLRNKRICLLIAHPDDEAMFFAPTLLALTRPDTGNHVKILCLSTGNQDGLGDTRREELKKSAKLLGLRDEDDALVLDDPYVFSPFRLSPNSPHFPQRISVGRGKSGVQPRLNHKST